MSTTRLRGLPLLLFLASCGARSVLVPSIPGSDAGLDASAATDASDVTDAADASDATTCAPEVCDGLDDDCDGRVDEGLLRVQYADLDHDGFGNDADVVTACPDPERVELAGDCDDARADVSPGTGEACTGDADEDCDGLVDCGDEDCACTPPPKVIPRGRFWMGSPRTEQWHEMDEEPLHEVEITYDLVVMSTEVTQAQWRELTGTSPSHFVSCGDTCPVESINWFEAVYFANLRSAADGLAPCYRLGMCRGTLGAGCSRSAAAWTFCPGDFECAVEPLDLACEGWRLPTEAEWEYFARAGSMTAFSFGDSADALSDYGWCSSAGAFHTHPVATLLPNAWGLQDVSGNVYEWVWDFDGAYPSAAQTDPTGPPSGLSRVIRGGAFTFGDEYCRSANRGARAPYSRESVIGLRLVRRAPE